MNTGTETRKTAELVQEGIAALISGRKAQARLLLGQALEADPHSEQGWLWLSGAVDTDEERRFCLRQVLSINEWNSAAQKGLKELGLGFARSPITPSTPTTVVRPPTWEATAPPQQVQQATSPAATKGSLPTAWLIMVVILAAGIAVGLLMLFVINSGSI
jgi:hypothetical protein